MYRSPADDDQRRHLSNAQNECDNRQDTGPWYVGDKEGKADEDRLNESDADDS